MPVITKEEVKIITGPDGTKKEKSTIMRKLNAFQRKMVDPYHIKDINSFISWSVVLANKKVKKSNDPDKTFVFDRAFHNEMNKLTKKEGLRV